MTVKFYADIGSNHNQNLTRALNLIKLAKDIGCSGVKFQLFQAEKLWKDPQKIKETKKQELSLGWLLALSRKARSLRMEFGVTPFHVDMVERASEFADYLKISSLEMSNLNLIKKCYSKKLPLMLSMGVTDKKELAKILSALSSINGGWESITPVHILGCTSKYPAKREECNLAAINIFGNGKGYGVESKIGWSDHTCSPTVINQAIICGAEIIEFHLDLEEKAGFENIGHCWQPKKIKAVIDAIRLGEQALGTHDWEIIKEQQKEVRKMKADPITGFRGT